MNFLSKQFRFLTGALLIGFVFSSCERTVNVTLQSAVSILVVDAWITNKPTRQAVVLTMTQPYFDSAQPKGVSGATVQIRDLTNGTLYSFIENPSTKGSYEWTPTRATFGVVGHTYQLNITVNGELFQATSRMGRVPPIDSITFSREMNRRSNDDRVVVQFWAIDPKGPDDTYWIRTSVNNVLQTLPKNIHLAYDAGLSKGTGADGVEFLYPIRSGVTPSNLMPDDSLSVELMSLNVDSFNYLIQVATQTNRPGGFGELFSTPLANVSTNIINVNGTKAIGFFNVGSVSTLCKKFVKHD